MDLNDDDITELFYESDTTLVIEDTGVVLVKSDHRSPNLVGVVAMIKNVEFNLAFKQMYLCNKDVAKELGKELLIYAALADASEPQL